MLQRRWRRPEESAQLVRGRLSGRTVAALTAELGGAGRGLTAGAIKREAVYRLPVAHTLVIVESPTKARTIRGFLPKEFRVEASMGHVRDLPNNASEIPAAHKGEKWANLGVNTANDFEPLYVVPKDKKKVVKELKDALKGADQLLLVHQGRLDLLVARHRGRAALVSGSADGFSCIQVGQLAKGLGVQRFDWALLLDPVAPEHPDRKSTRLNSSHRL